MTLSTTPNYPTTLDTLPEPTASTQQNATGYEHDLLHILHGNIEERLEAKVGVDGSAVTTSHDYKLSGVTGTDKAVSKTGTETLTNKTLTSPKINEDVSVTSTATELNKVDGYTGDHTDLNKLDGVTDGTVSASKAVIVDASKDIDFGTGDVSATDIDSSGTITAAAITATGELTFPNASIDTNFLNTGAAAGYVATLQTTTSTSFTDLATVGPSVTVTIGANGLCLIGLYSYISNNGTNSSRMTFAASGANTIAAGTAYSLENYGTNGNKYAATHLLTGLTAGSTTFTAKYNVAGGTGTFIDRRIFAIPL